MNRIEAKLNTLKQVGAFIIVCIKTREEKRKECGEIE